MIAQHPVWPWISALLSLPLTFSLSISLFSLSVVLSLVVFLHLYLFHPLACALSLPLFPGMRSAPWDQPASGQGAGGARHRASPRRLYNDDDTAAAAHHSAPATRKHTAMWGWAQGTAAAMDRWRARLTGSRRTSCPERLSRSPGECGTNPWRASCLQLCKQHKPC